MSGLTPPRREHGYLDQAGRGVHAIAHRGGASDGTENTLGAFERALGLGFTHLETDVHATLDGELVIAHDPDLRRVAGHPGIIARMTAAELAAVRVAGREPIPALSELVSSFPQARLSIDLKSDAAVVPLARLLQHRPELLARVCLGSLSAPRVLALRRRFGSAVCTAATRQEVFRLYLAARTGRRPPAPAADVLAIPPHWPEGRSGGRRLDLTEQRFLAAAREVGTDCHVWTVNDATQMRTLLGLGVDGIISDEVVVLREVLQTAGLW